MGTIENAGQANTGRRRFLGVAAGAVIATQLGISGRAQATAPEGTLPVRSASSGPGKQINGVRPFRIEVPQKEINELRQRVKMTRWPDKETVADRSQGVQLAKLRPLVEYWGTHYDWRKVETKLNALPQFITKIDGLDIR